jgi:hypothetical protein
MVYIIPIVNYPIRIENVAVHTEEMVEREVILD